jgi:hypothetical protein
MKTILEWYEELPEPIRSQAIANNNLSDFKKSSSLERAIQEAFLWDDTPEGFDYWFVISNKAKAGEYDTQPTLEQSLSYLTKTLEEMKEAIESVRKAIGNERV